MTVSPISDLGSAYEESAHPTLVNAAFIDTYWTAERCESFLNDRLSKVMNQHKAHKANRSASLSE